MCRNIKTLHNFKPPATDEEIRASSLQFVRKLSGFTQPSKANEPAFARAVDQVTRAAHELLDSLTTNAPPRDREVDAAKARARAADRFRSSEVLRTPGLAVTRSPRWTRARSHFLLETSRPGVEPPATCARWAQSSASPSRACGRGGDGHHVRCHEYLKEM